MIGQFKAREDSCNVILFFVELAAFDAVYFGLGLHYIVRNIALIFFIYS